MNKLFLLLLLFFFTLTENSGCTTRKKANTDSPFFPDSTPSEKKEIRTGAEQIDKYLSLLKNKNIGLVVNHTSIVGNTHIVDTLLALGVKVKKIFAPEHGFRGKADAGEKVNNEIDEKTGLPIISLYGNNKKPTAQQLKDLDIIIFDIQDVGVRFYTYISTMDYIMQACAENKKELIILDRPNPNGFYVDGPVLDPAFKSFVGMLPIPVVHGLTIGELASMMIGEKWVDSAGALKIKIIKNENYSHKDKYSLPVKPSPNLPNDLSIKLYPSLGLFEGTIMSVGRGTSFPFQVIGAPGKEYGSYTFTPKSIPGMAKNPPFENLICNGIDLRSEKDISLFTLKYVIEFYKKTPDKEKYFNNFFNKLIGNDWVIKKIKAGESEDQIKEAWQKDLNAYKKKRKKYLLYEDFE